MNADLILTSLKARYFAIILTENYPQTPAVTQELDALEKEIRQRCPEAGKTTIVIRKP